MNERQKDTHMLYRMLSWPEESDEARDTRPSLLPCLGYALLGLLTVIMLTVAIRVA